MNIEPPILYTIDAQDRIISVSPAWDDFARNNDAPELAGGSIIGRLLWEFIGDAGTADIYRQILSRVRAGETVRFTLRCDGPDRKRLLGMTIRPLEGDRVEFESQTIQLDPRAAIPLLGRDGGSGPPLKICAWCARMPLDDNRWVEVEEAVAELQLLEAAEVPRLSHGICGQCAARFSGGV